MLVWHLAAQSPADLGKWTLGLMLHTSRRSRGNRTPGAKVEVVGQDLRSMRTQYVKRTLHRQPKIPPYTLHVWHSTSAICHTQSTWRAHLPEGRGLPSRSRPARSVLRRVPCAQQRQLSEQGFLCSIKEIENRSWALLMVIVMMAATLGFELPDLEC